MNDRKQIFLNRIQSSVEKGLYEVALKDLEEMGEGILGKDGLSYEKAVIAFQKGDYVHARRSLEEIIDQGPSSSFYSRAQLLTGFSFREQKKYPQALAVFQAFLTEAPESEERPRVFQIAALCAEEIGDWQTAEKMYVEAEPLTPDAEAKEEIRLRLAHAYGMLKSWPKAIQIYQSILVSEISELRSVDVMFQLGVCYLKGGEYGRSIQSFTEVLEAEGDGDKPTFRAEMAREFRAKAMLKSSATAKQVKKYGSF